MPRRLGLKGLSALLSGGLAALLFALVFATLPLAPAKAQAFQDLTFLALTKDPRIEAAIAGANAQAARVRQTQTGGRLQIRGVIEAESSEASSSIDSETARLELSRQVYDFGQLSSSVEAQAARLDLAWLEVAQINQDVFAEVAQAYARVLEADALLAIRRAFVLELEDRAESIEQRIVAGISGITELQGLSRRQAGAEIEALLAEQATLTTRLELERLSGIYAQQVSRGSLSATLNLIPQSLEETLRLADVNSPEAQVAAQRFRIVEADALAENRSGRPVIEAYGQVNAGETQGQAFSDSDLGFRLSLPLYQGGLRGAVAQEEALNLQEALRLRQQDQLQIRQNAAVAWTNLTIAYRAEQVWERVLLVQQERVEAIENELDADLVTLDVLLDARADLVETQADQVQAVYDIVRAQLSLLRAVGLASLTKAD